MQSGSRGRWYFLLLVVSLLGVTSPDRVAMSQAPPAPAEQLLRVQLAQAGGGDGPRLYRYRNSSRPVDSRKISGDRMHVRLDASLTDTPTYVQLDDQRFMALCADEDGCRLTVSMIGWVELGRVLPTPTTTGTCRFFIRVIDAKRHWQIDRSCPHVYAVWHTTDDGKSVWRQGGNPGRFTPYYSLLFGIDGVDSIEQPADDRGWILISTGCGVAEAPPLAGAKNASVAADTSPGFYLIASTPAWGGTSYPQAQSWPGGAGGRACELLVED